MKRRIQDLFSIVQFRRRLAYVDALPQLSLLALACGLITGIVMVAFRLAVEGTLVAILPGGSDESFESLPWEWYLVLPTVGGLVIGLAFERLSPERRNVGVVHVIERLARHQGHLPLSNALAQFLGGIVALATGQSAGREGPAIHLGAAASSLLGQRLRLPNNSIRTLVGCGTAAAIAASFDTPIAGVIFAMEVVMMEYTVVSFIPVIIASVAATLVAKLVYGSDVAFTVPPLQMDNFLEIPFVIMGGLLIGALAAAFSSLVELFGRLKRFPTWLRFTAAGALTGCAALLAPEVLGVGYDSVNAALAGQIGLGALVLIAVLKLTVSAASTGLGIPAGFIGPVLVIGAMAGGVIGHLGGLVWPEQASSAGFYVVVGMGAMMAAVLQAPLAALMAVLELTSNTTVILPAMLAIVVATLTTSQVFHRKSLFLTVLEARGLTLDSDPLTQALQRAGVGSQMERRIVRLRRRVGIDEAWRALRSEPRWIVIDTENGPEYVLAAADLTRHLESLAEDSTAEAGAGDTTTGTDDTDATIMMIDLMAIPGLRKDVVLVQFQATLHEAMSRLKETGREAVCVTRTAAPMITPIIGVLTRDDIEKYYGFRG
ncbi:MAG TPA: chloride channel protein [Pseudomonadales bacterium]|nr:chloride channel protein [Pseudomonadales bacterium]